MRTTILVVANQTATSDELFATLQERASSRIRVDLLVPPEARSVAKRDEAGMRLEQALARLHESGFEATGRVGDCDPLAAVVDAYDPTRHDEILVSTLPASVSHWMGIDLPARISRATNALVTQVAMPEPRSVARPTETVDVRPTMPAADPRFSRLGRRAPASRG